MKLVVHNHIPRTTDGDTERAFLEAKRHDALGFLRGFKRLKTVPDRDVWNAEYRSDSDTIAVEGKFEKKTFSDKVHTLLHEAGHRGQYLNPALYQEFKKRQLNKLSNFLNIANETHLKEYERRGSVDSVAAEVFAESYSRAVLGLYLPEELKQFWQKELSR